MKRNARGEGFMMALLPLGLVCVFAVCSLALALIGGRAYRDIQEDVALGYDSRIAATYLRTKLSQDNVAGAATLRTEGTYEVLVLARATDSGSLETRIYMDGGKLKEAYVPAGTAFDASLGTAVAVLDDCVFTIDENGLFTADIVCTDGQPQRMQFALAGGEGGRV